MNLLSKFTLVAGVAAIAIAFSPVGSFAAAKKAAKASEPARGWCTGSCGPSGWCYLRWRTAGGTIVPTGMPCAQQHCPAKCG